MIPSIPFAQSTSPFLLKMKAQLVILLLWGGRHCHVYGSYKSIDSAYDTNKSVFSPQGKLIQLDYIEGIVKRGNLCIGAECEDGVVLATNKLMSADTAKLVEDDVRRIYKVDNHVGILPAGLPADGRALAHKAIEYCRFHRREYGEPIPGRVLAERLGDLLHTACVRWGSRAYPNALFIACWEEDLAGCHGGDDDAVADSLTLETGTQSGKNTGDEHDDSLPAEELGRDAGFQLYVVEPNGSVRRCRAACTGRGSSSAQTWLHSRTIPVISKESEETSSRAAERPAASVSPEREEGRLLSEMTCPEATRVLGCTATRISESESPASHGRRARATASITEVAWLRAGNRQGSTDRIEFVHYRSLERFLEEEEGAKEHEAGSAGEYGDGDKDGSEVDG